MMVSSSSSPLSNNMIMNLSTKYDVFLNFRGEDTRDNFVSHLYSALCRKKIETFVDNQLISGNEISPSLLNAIESSKISIVIFSQGYASSRWCLEELVKILECKTNHGQIVFYGVDPCDVRKQTGTFENAFSKLKEKFQGELNKLEEWRNALRDVANLSGFDYHVIRPESHLIEKITNNILDRLCDTFQSDSNGLVGVRSRIKEIESLLKMESRDVRIFEIWGIGGIGKTTIISIIFNKISKYFEGSYFAESIREVERNGELRQLQRELFSTILENESVKSGLLNLSLQSKRLNHKKALIVFDDVTHLKQIEFLIGNFDRFGPGSRIIITTRDKQVLQNCRANEIYKVEELVYSDALKLFSGHAFKKHLLNESYIELSKKVIEYAHGVPLALKVLGCYLFGKNKEVWEDIIRKLKKIPNAEIQKVLKISYDGLDENEKKIFLDIVFFFIGKNKDLVANYFYSCGYYPEIEISVLVDKSLITISENKIFVHDLLQNMGREIARQESIDNPGKRSRLCDHEDICKVLRKNKGTDIIEGISLNMDQIEEIRLNPHAFKKMSNLRFLNFYHLFMSKNKCKLSHIQGKVFTEVSFFWWDGYPLKSLPSGFKPENLASFILFKRNLEQLWDGVQNLVNLKHIDLRRSTQLKKLPDLSLSTNLETLKLDDCTSLIEINSSILHLNKLVLLTLEYWVSLKSLPTSICSESLEKLYLNGCSNLQRLPDELGNLKSLRELRATGTTIREIPSSIRCLSKLDTLVLVDCKSLRYLYLLSCSNLEELSFMRSEDDENMGFLLPISLLPLDGLLSLAYVDLSDCGIIELPENLGQLSSLQWLSLDKNNFERIPPSIIHLSNLRYLSINACKGIRCFPELPCQILRVNASGCTSLKAFSGPSFLFAPQSSYQKINFRNCLQLKLNELNQMVENAHPKIQVSITEWQKRKEVNIWCGRAPNGLIYFPGSKIPKWFSYQGMGSSIILQLPPSLYSHKFIGIELCAIVSFEEHCDFRWDLNVLYERKCKTNWTGVQ